MTALRHPQPHMTEDEYLTFERASEIRHEYLYGQVYAMSGASEEHNLICGTTSFLLYGHLRKRPCKVYQTDMRVKADTLYTYPDLVVMCSEAQFMDAKFDTLLNPTLIIEVLSPSTERHDRGRKFEYYREIETLQEYVLISQDSPHIEHFLRQDDGTWRYTDVKGLNTHITLTSIDCTLSLAEVYEQITFTGK